MSAIEFDTNNALNDQTGIRELSLDECDQVGGGVVLLGVSIAISSLVALKIGINVGSAMVAIVSLLQSRGLYNRKSLKRISGSTSGALSNGGGFGSDRRIKQDIRVEGEISSLGLTAYTWEYKNAPGERFVGVMAQDLLARDDLKSSVFTFTDGPFEGFYGVDYAVLGLRCLPTEAWDGDVASLTVREIAFAA